MKRCTFVLILMIVLLTSLLPAHHQLSSAPAALAQEGATATFNGPCALLSKNFPRSPECDVEIAANQLQPLERAVEYVEERDGQAHPRSVFLPEHSPDYPIAWQKRPWYFSDAPGTLPADDDWTTARLIGKYAMYYVYDAVEEFDGLWYLIGPGQWMHEDFVSVLQIAQKPEEVHGPWVALDLQNQTLVAYMDEQPVYATLISAGYWLQTLEGLFQVYARTLSMVMKGPPGADPPSYIFPTRWVMFFNGDEALHSADFHNYFGINRTHGCVNLAPGDAEWVWNFFEQTVDQWHPSGTRTFFVDHPEQAPWVYVYSAPEFPGLPSW